MSSTGTRVPKRPPLVERSAVSQDSQGSPFAKLICIALKDHSDLQRGVLEHRSTAMMSVYVMGDWPICRTSAKYSLHKRGAAPLSTFYLS